MSIGLMTAVWRLGGLSPTQKLVLLSLADNANDQGECYPSLRQISERTCLTDRAVRIAIRALEDAGIVRSISRSGTSTVYFLSVPTPERDSAPPRNDVPPTPERRSAKPSLNRQLNRQGTVNRPTCVPERVWSDFLAIRTAKRAPLTETALRGLEREAEKAGMSLPDAIRECCERGWQSLRASWLTSGQQARASPPQSRYAATIAALTGRSDPQPEDVIDVDSRTVSSTAAAIAARDG